MDPEATLTATPAPAAEAQAAPDTGTAKMIPFPADKLRALNQELSELRRNQNQPALPNKPAQEAIEPTAQRALDMISDSVDSKLDSRLDPMRNDMESMRFDREIENLRNDPIASRYANEIADEMAKLGRKNPNASRADLLDQAKRNAVYDAAMSGRFETAVTERAAEELLSDRSRFATTPARGGVQTGRGNEDRALEDYSTEELAADPAKFAALFEKTQGRKPRR